MNSPFTFVYEETPLHCLLRPLPLLRSHHRSGRKQRTRMTSHTCEGANTQLHGCPLVLQYKVTRSTGCNQLDKKNSENSLSLHLTRLFQATVMLPFLNFGAIDFRTDRNTLGTENIMFQIRPHPRSPNRSEPSNPPKSTIQIIELIWHS